MKKVLFLIAIFFASVSINEVKAQDGLMGIDAQFGLPMGDVDDFSSVQVGINFNYYFVEVMEALKIGGRLGYSTFVIDSDFSDGLNNPSFLMAGASARYDFSESLFARLDLGYAIGLNDGNDGAMFLEPRLGYNLGNFDLFAFYQTILDSDFSYGALGVGFALKF